MSQNALQLKRTAIALFTQGVSSTRFCRLLHNDYQILFNDDIPSPDDFYDMLSESNKPMRDLLHMLGFEYTNFGICLRMPNENILTL